MVVMSGPGDDYDQRVDTPRLRQRIYVHNHPCSLKGKQFVYNPPTQGGIMFVTIPVCVEADLELALVESKEV